MQQARNSLQKAQQRIGITAYMSNDAVKAQIEKAIGRNSDQFVTSIISAVNANPQLQECTNASILSAALVGQSLKLSPSPQLGQYYFVPYKNNRTGTTEAQFQIGYRGMYQLAIRSGQFKKLNALAIKEGELVNFNPLEEEIEILIDRQNNSINNSILSAAQHYLGEKVCEGMKKNDMIIRLANEGYNIDDILTERDKLGSIAFKDEEEGWISQVATKFSEEESECNTKN